MKESLKQRAQKILSPADVRIGGSRPWDIQVNNENFYARVFEHGSLGLGESYMDGWWDSHQLDQFFHKILRADLQKTIKPGWLFLNYLLATFLNTQNKTRSKVVAKIHYDLGNNFYEKMLDTTMIYSCAYWKNAKDLNTAQQRKLDLICKKIMLRPGEKVLDIGSGWGGLARFAAENYDCEVTGVNISQEQLEYSRVNSKGFPIKFIESDYREIYGTFDKVVAIGFFEHVGYKNYRTLMKVAHRCLRDGGLFLLHTIGGNLSGRITEPWLDKYIFPNSMIPSMKQISEASEGLFVLEDFHNFGSDYDKTLMAWHKNFEKNWPQFKNKYGEKFYRMWRYYLLSCAGTFRARINQLWQIVFSKGGTAGGYESIR